MLSFWPRSLASRQVGFTLVELVMVIALAGLVAVMISTVMSRPMQGFVDQSRRAELVDLAGTALNRMARDIRLAVPNSVRIGGSGELEFLRAPTGGRYRANLLGGIRQNPPVCDSDPCVIPVPSPPDLNEIVPAESVWMVIYSVGSPGNGNSVWSDPEVLADGTNSSVISPAVTVAQAGNDLSLSGPGIESFRFKYASPQYRFYLADSVLGYRCVGGASGRIERDEFAALNDDYAYGNASVVVDHVDCDKSSFTYSPSTNARSGLVTLRLTLTQDGETITLLQQVHVDNAP